MHTCSINLSIVADKVLGLISVQLCWRQGVETENDQSQQTLE